MKYKNKDRVIEIINKIDELNKKHAELDGASSVRVNSMSGYEILTSYKEASGLCSDLAYNYIIDCRNLYYKQIEKLKSELETL